MILRRVRLGEAPAIPWANGRGTTRELLRNETAEGRLLVRLSVADVVEPGPFSRLPGLDRVLVAIEGPGFELAIDGRKVAVRPLEPVAFAGEADVAVRVVAGPSRDFNVMTDRAAGRARVGVHRGSFLAPAGNAVFVFVVAGAFTAEGDPASLGPGDLAVLAPHGAQPFRGRGEAILVATMPP